MGVLALAPKSSGYDIKKIMEGSTQHFWKESYGAIYPVLGGLLEDGMIRQLEDPAVSGRQKNVYELTKKGSRELKEWMNMPVEREQFRNELLLKLFFGEISPISTTRKHVEEYREACISKEKIYNGIKDKLLKEQKNEPGLPYWLMTLDYGNRQLKASLDWCECALIQFNKMEKL